MKHLKKTLLTLVALLALTTQAWADDVITVTWNSGGSYENNNSRDGVTLSGDIVQYSSGEWQLAYANKSGTFTTELGNFTSIVITGGWIKNDAFSGEGWSGRTWTGNASSVPFSGYLTSDMGDAPWTITFTIEPASSATAITFTRGTGDKANEWTMDGGMPAGNVTVSVLYYDLATLATDAVTAATEAAANTDAELVTVADNAATGGTLMYYVTTDANFTQAQAIALAETAWSEDVPTADGFNFDTATDVYVWYYLKGDAEHSDTDPVCVAVTLLPEPTYNVEFAEGTPEADKWSAEPNTGVKKGKTVTVTYSGTRKVIGVKAEKKSAYEHSLTIAVDPSTQDPIATAPAMTIEFNTGETWADVAARYDWLKTYMTYTVYYDADGKDGNVHDTNGGVTPDKTIDPNGSYHWGL